MKKFILGFLLIPAFVDALAQKTIHDPHAEKREAKNFHSIEVSSGFKVYLTQGSEESVAVSAPEAKHRDNIQVDVKGGVLLVRYNNSGKWNSSGRNLKVYISFRQLNEFNASGACDVVVVDNWKEENLKMELSGASNLRGSMEVRKLKVELSGASDMTLTGRVGELNLEASGASDFKGYDLEVDYCDAHASGASDIKITVNKELSAEASGASDVKFKGPGLIRGIKTSGSSNITRRT